jgi:two-component system LytT family response regulator
VSTAVRAVLIDDEPLARKRLRTLLADEPRIQVLGEAGTGSSAIELIERTKPDLVFLDIQMPGLSGFDVLQQLELEKLPLVIFVTAFDEHALRAFEVNALDYLLKPVTEPRFRAAVTRALERAQGTDAGLSRDVLTALARMSRDSVDRIPIRSANGGRSCADAMSIGRR